MLLRLHIPIVVGFCVTDTQKRVCIFLTARNDTVMEKCFGHKHSMFHPKKIFYSVAEAFLGSRASLLNSKQHEGPKVDNN